jgi:drug/metabolite transporter (DMT)-like permease
MNTFLLYSATVLIWGSTWIAINYQLGEVAPEVSLFYRFGLASIMLFSYCILRRKPLKFPLKMHIQLAIFGLLLFGINYYLLYLAQQHINSALTAIAFSTLMVANIINARFWYHQAISPQVYIGGSLGMIGIVTLFWPQLVDVNVGEQTMIGLSLSLLGTLCASAGNMISIRNQQQHIPVLQANAWGMFYGAIFMAALTLLQGKPFNFEWTWSYVGSLFYLSLFGSVIAFGCYLTLMTRIGAHKTSYSSVMFPAVAVVISTFVENFNWSVYAIIGFSCIVMGNLIVLAPKRRDKIIANNS